MPDVYIHHRERVGIKNGLYLHSGKRLQEFLMNLRTECAIRFSVDEWQVSPTDFSVYDVPLTGFSDQTQDVVVRINLHHFPARVARGDDRASQIADMVSTFLNTDDAVKFRGRVTVGVSLVFAEIAWATA